jgi:hypothetical protein
MSGGHILGMNSLMQFALPAGWDSSELLKHQLADGITYQEMLNDIAVALQEVGGALASDPRYGGMVSFTTELGFEYAQGTALTGMEERTEYRTADARRGATVGHMLPLKSFDRKLQWTWDFLRKARRIQLDNDIMVAMYDVRDEFERRVLTRFFTNAEYQLGSSGYDLPIANASSAVAYVPPAFNGKTFASSHTHFVRDTTANRVAAIKTGVASLREHGIMAPFNGIVPTAEVSTYTALSNFVRPERNLSRYNGSSDMATGEINEQVYFGALETDFGLIYLWETERLPSTYFGLYKSYGSNDPRNPLAVRHSEDLGSQPIMKPTGNHPLEGAEIIHEYGVGVNGAPMTARLNGYCIHFDAAGDYDNPTIS